MAGGRPRIELNEDDWKKLDQMAHIQCTGEEMAAIMGFSYDTLELRVKEKHGVSFAEWFRQRSCGGKMSLRRFQYDAAKRGNPTMLIWLGKQYLDQKDHKDIDLGDSVFTLKYDPNKE